MISKFTKLSGISLLSKEEQLKINGKGRTCSKEIGWWTTKEGNTYKGWGLTCFYDDGSIKHYNIIGNEVTCATVSEISAT
ncbi:hypothetical protein ACOSP6_16145 [Tenacibaculum sp. MEBiC06402]|uniref:hypothetical protein n=1 Tax=unclassified Tenacibaculum TaxID=2635139 RepID=UPI003B9D7D2D